MLCCLLYIVPMATLELMLAGKKQGQIDRHVTSKLVMFTTGFVPQLQSHASGLEFNIYQKYMFPLIESSMNLCYLFVTFLNCFSYTHKVIYSKNK